MRMLFAFGLFLLLASIGGWKFFHPHCPPRPLHVGIDQHLLDVVAQWPEKLDRTRRKGSGTQWTVDDALPITENVCPFSVTIDIADAPMHIEATRFAWLDVTGGRVTEIYVTMSAEAQTAAEMQDTLHGTIEQLVERGWKLDGTATPEAMQQDAMEWAGVHVKDASNRKLYWTFKKPHQPDASIQVKYLEDQNKYIVDVGFYDFTLQDRIYKASEFLGYTVFTKIDDMAEYSAAIDHALHKGDPAN